MLEWYRYNARLEIVREASSISLKKSLEKLGGTCLSVTGKIVGHSIWEDKTSSAFDWRAKAACRDKDPELFFPVGNTGAAYQQIEEAKAVCRTCKVIDACLKCALDTNQDYGVWGGLSEDERRQLKRKAMRLRRSQAMQMQI